MLLITRILSLIVLSFLILALVADHGQKNKGCEYCLRKVPVIDEEHFEIRIINGNWLIANFGGKAPDSTTFINYCPMCGRKL